eukprot:CAMPEP_0177189888 /NCGR_PEP_ID=MMETSP0367-20130122/20515_1 /TAXON_ID=447022 ORGANISM="Scrippsiella hangoei-like, Strain SHHI-4" /NCGR_SAMPLE_ID=MMETSP0367 /ASSEMBLY_ACC=CAM_ASM_000362 /LENGTH=56 /DNA_ID=CAMNT_0018637469 /DNA_START=40 /DNA_END=207 /DNA_ORIENTATION=+
MRDAFRPCLSVYSNNARHVSEKESEVFLCKLDTAILAAKVEKSWCFCDMYAQVSAA